MVTMRSVSTETPVAEKNFLHQNIEKKEISEYEKCREERIKENLERMKKLGILDLSLKLKTTVKPPRARNNNNAASSSSIHKTPQPMRHLGPVRRSSRLGNATPVSYSEVSLSMKGSFETEEELLREGFNPEAYTEEQKKLLGCTNASWTLCVDGYGKDGKRIYDPINGKTCHQCRQKTLGYRTQCSQCCKIQGQFCGDCLYMRYGENVLEALENPDWVCPVCRGICNCSFCRSAKGRAPTGLMYRKISKLGFKSVAHYLLETECRTTNLEEGTKVPVSAKRSLAFASPEATSMLMESADSKDNLKESVELKFEKDKMNEDHKGEELEGSNSTPETNDQGSLMPKPKDNCQHGENNVDGNVETETGLGSAKISADVVTNKEAFENEHCDSIVVKKNATTSKRKTSNHSEPMPDSIGARLRAAKISADVVTNKEDSVQYMENESCDNIVAKKNATPSKRKTPNRSELMTDSIGARLRARRKICSE